MIIFLVTRVFGNRNEPTVTPSQTGAAQNAAPSKQVTLNYWGLWETSEVLEDVLEDFETTNPGVKVNYIKQSHKDYRERLQTAVASGNGPDLFRFHASWTPMLSSELAPLPQSVMSASDFKSTFYPVAADQLQIDGQIVGIPLMYDGLALYYNKEILRIAGEEPPRTWAQLRTLATKLTIRSSSKIERAGLAAGNSTNVEHFSDIIGLLLLQNGADPSDPTSTEARDALLFYTNFINKDDVWDGSLPSSTVAFARGDVAMMLAPSWRAHEVKAINPSLEFGITSSPQLADEKLSWASYWAEGVSSKSQNKDEAWQLLKFLSSADVQKKLYSSQSQIRSFGEIYSRVDLADELADDELVSAFLSDAPSAQGWYISSFTHDSGLNDLLIKYYEDAITAVLAGKQITDVQETLDQGTRQILRQYGAD